jgi:hypothetical protein
MTALLVVLLLAAVAGLGIVGFFAVQGRIAVARLEADLAARQERYDHDHGQWKEQLGASKGQYQALVAKYEENGKRWQESSAAMKAEIQRLAKWKNVADADAVAAEMARTAHVTLEKAKAEATQIVSSARESATALTITTNEQAATTLAEARQKAKALKTETETILDSATAHAGRIIDDANRRAREIAGGAHEVMKNASHYEQTVRAMRNVIDGYGDRYLVPEQSFLDDLAAEFGHVQAGAELKRVRECTKIMIRNGTAAVCDYVETNRRETAVNFVVDAFNGKVDSILSRVKHDNVGKLGQQIRDAFALVNHNGKAFRDARIREEYLAVRVEELKWAALVQHLALKQREEQREAKERIREEARAAKEIERALKEAGKEEELLQRAITQAQEQFQLASGEQKAMYEARLKEMDVRLKEAMARKERARAMAEQTKRGHVYIISNLGSFGEDVYKIGLSRRWDPMDRINELGGASVPFGFDVHAMIMSDNAPALELRLHELFTLKQVNKVNSRKEFFRVGVQEIREAIEKLGVTGVSWTMTAAAKEYRETLATEKRIQESAAEREKWVKQQRRQQIEAASDSLALVGDDADEE